MVRKGWILATVVLLWFGLSEAAVANEGATARIQRQYETITSFQAEFTQELRVAASREADERRGKLFYQHPGLIRWESTDPEPELLIVGAEEVWNYFAEEEIAYRYSSREVLGSAMVLRILSGQARLEEDFLTEETLDDSGAFRQIRLVPRNPEPNLVEATIWVDPATFLLHQVLAVDFYGNTNQITLHNLRLNPDLDPSLFKFAPPTGVEVQDSM